MPRFLSLEGQVRLQRHWYDLCDGLGGGFALSLAQLLVKNGVITSWEKETINPDWPTLKQNETLLNCVLCSDDETFRRFVQVLEDHLPWLSESVREDVPEDEIRRYQELDLCTDSDDEDW